MKIITALQAMVARHETDEVLITDIVTKVNAFLPDTGKIPLKPTPTPEFVIAVLTSLDSPLRDIVESLPAESHSEDKDDKPKPLINPAHLQRPPWTKDLFTAHLSLGLAGAFLVSVALFNSTTSFSPEMMDALYEWVKEFLGYI